MKTFARYSLLLACLSVAFAAGCRNRPGNDGNGNDNGNNGEVPADVQKAVDDVVAQLESTSQSVGGATDALVNVDQATSDTLGNCPQVVFVRQNNVTTFALTFVAGCSSDYYDESVSGSISAEFNRNTGTFTATFNEFTVGDQTTDGSLNVNRVAAGDVRDWTGSINVSTSGVGSEAGDIAFTINALSDTLTISSASLEVTDADGVARSVDVSALVMRPVANSSFIPEAGTISFEVPNDANTGPETVTVIIEFDSNSPFDRTVTLTVGESVFANYPLGAF